MPPIADTLASPSLAPSQVGALAILVVKDKASGDVKLTVAVEEQLFASLTTTV